MSVVVGYAQTVSEFLEACRWKTFSHHVSKLLRCGYMKDLAFPNCNFLSDEVHIKLNVFCAFVMHRIGAHVASRDIVAEDYRSFLQRAVEFT
jgi:hypothetical protein